jgi:F0F1-type ATP synthase epsilon subunit
MMEEDRMSRVLRRHNALVETHKEGVLRAIEERNEKKKMVSISGGDV